MAETFAREARYLDPSQATAGVRASARESGGTVYVVKATIELASQAIGDTVVLGRVPVGRSFLYGVITSTATLGSATVAVGTRSTAAAYRSAATFTTANTPALFGVGATVGAMPTEAAEDIIATVAAAALPASGTLTVHLYFTGP